MARKPLTEAAILTAEPSASGERLEIPDGKVDGLYLRVGQRKKTWIYRYRNKSGKHRRMTIGRFAPPEGEKIDPTRLNNQQIEELSQRGRLGLAEAREVARLYSKRVAQDIDPQAELFEAREAIRTPKAMNSSDVVVTVEQGIGRYIEGHVNKYNKPRRYLVDGTPVYQRSDDASRWIVPNIGHERIEDLTHNRVKNFHAKIVKEHGPRSADVAVEILRSAMNYLRDEGIREDALPIRMKKSKAEKRKAIRRRYLEDNEIKIFWKACDSVDHIYGKFVMTLLLTGQRREEVAGMRWDDLHEDASRWLIKDTKNEGNMLVPLSRQVQNLIATVPRIGDCVFRLRADKPISSFTTCKKCISDAIVEISGAELPDWRFHDLRRTFRTNLSRLRIAYEVREACLNHARDELAEIYDQWDYYEEKAEAFQKWANLIDQIVHGEPEKSNVLEFQEKV
jgi:integrase